MNDFRVTYDAYGEARHHIRGWPVDLDGDGAVTTMELSAILAIANGSDNAIGEVNYADSGTFLAQAKTRHRVPGSRVIDGG